MRGKLSWLTFSIIGGAIVAAILIFVYFFLIKGFIASQLAINAIKPWGTLMSKYDEAMNLGSSVIEEFYVGSGHIVDVVDDYPYGLTFEGSRKEMDNINAILIMDNDEVKKIKSTKLLDRRSMAQLARCSGSKFCFCAARISLNDNYVLVKHVLDSYIIDEEEETIYTIPSIYGTDTGDVVSDCLSQSASKVELFACKGESRPLYYGGVYVKIIQFFYSRTVYLNKETVKLGDNSVDVINMYFVPDCGGYDYSHCINVTTSCPYSTDKGKYGDW